MVDHVVGDPKRNIERGKQKKSCRAINWHGRSIVELRNCYRRETYRKIIIRGRELLFSNSRASAVRTNEKLVDGIGERDTPNSSGRYLNVFALYVKGNGGISERQNAPKVFK